MCIRSLNKLIEHIIDPFCIANSVSHLHGKRLFGCDYNFSISRWFAWNLCINLVIFILWLALGFHCYNQHEYLYYTLIDNTYIGYSSLFIVLYMRTPSFNIESKTICRNKNDIQISIENEKIIEEDKCVRAHHITYILYWVAIYSS